MATDPMPKVSLCSERVFHPDYGPGMAFELWPMGGVRVRFRDRKRFVSRSSLAVPKTTPLDTHSDDEDER